jgi:DTW domain-containing protein YfiP
VYHKTPVLILQDKKEAKHPFNTAVIATLALNVCQITTEQPFPETVLSRYPNRQPLLLFPNIDLSGSAAYLKNKPVIEADFLLLDEHNNCSANKPTDSIIDCRDGKIDSIERGEHDFVLVVIDASWRKAKRIYLEHEWLQSLTKLDIKPEQRSAYQIRQTKQDSFLSTIESIGLALGYLEPDFDQNKLLKPFEKMVQFHAR